jgi:hypothetical protein
MNFLIIDHRIIKRKIGFTLLPVALAGLSRITHLINIDTVEDIILVMRQLLEANSPPAPSTVKLHCVYCVLKTLSGPGQELGSDDELFVSTLCTLVLECCPEICEKEWHLVLECLEFVLIKKRENRISVVKNIVKCCFVVLPHLNSNATATTLALLHTVLLRYPHVRVDVRASATVIIQPTTKGNKTGALSSTKQLVIVEDVVADMAMTALRKESLNPQSGSGMQVNVNDDGNIMQNVDGDGSWVLNLLKFHVDSKVRSTAAQVTSREVVPLPYRPKDVIDDRMFFMDESFKRLPSNLKTTTPVVRPGSVAKANGKSSEKRKRQQKPGK